MAGGEGGIFGGLGVGKNIHKKPAEGPPPPFYGGRPLGTADEINAFAQSTASQGVSIDQLRTGGYSESQGLKGADQSNYDAFLKWRFQNEAEQKKYQEYIKLSQDRPGRAATILTVPDNKTVLG